MSGENAFVWWVGLRFYCDSDILGIAYKLMTPRNLFAGTCKQKGNMGKEKVLIRELG